MNPCPDPKTSSHTTPMSWGLALGTPWILVSAVHMIPPLQLHGHCLTNYTRWHCCKLQYLLEWFQSNHTFLAACVWGERWVERIRQSQHSSKYWHKTITKHYCKPHTNELVSLWMSTAQESASDSCIHVHTSSTEEYICRNRIYVSTGCRNWDEVIYIKKKNNKESFIVMQKGRYYPIQWRANTITQFGIFLN